MKDTVDDIVESVEQNDERGLSRGIVVGIAGCTNSGKSLLAGSLADEVRLGSRLPMSFQINAINEVSIKV